MQYKQKFAVQQMPLIDLVVPSTSASSDCYFFISAFALDQAAGDSNIQSIS